uniref:Peroxisomal ATPase PEX6 n=1 Tax=Plectus sambesii TaxID=2011161 RepID=A0A914UIG7_9BILA
MEGSGGTEQRVRLCTAWIPLSKFLFGLLLRSNRSRQFRRLLMTLTAQKRFNIAVIDCALVSQYCKTPKEDANSTIFLTPSSLFALRARFNTSQVVRITIYDQKGAAKAERQVKLRSLPPGVGDCRSVYVTSLFAFNCCTANDHIQAFSLSLSGAPSPSSPDVPVASVIKIALIKSPMYSEKIDAGAALKTYFDTPRLMRQGDVFIVRLNFIFQSDVISVAFKVMELIGQGRSDESFWVRSDEATLFQVPAINSETPIMNESSVQDFLLSPNHPLPVFNSHVETLSHLICASFSISDAQALCLLLHGGAGCGKRLITARVAAKCRAHLCQVDCYDLWAEVAGASEAKIRAAFNRAKSFSPAVLLLRNIDILGIDSQTGSVDSRVTGALRSCLSELAGCQVAVIATCSTSKASGLSTDLASEFLYEIEIKNLMENDRFELLNAMLPFDAKRNVDVRRLAQRTAGFALADLHSLLHDAKYSAVTRVGHNGKLNMTQADFDAAIQLNHDAYSDAIGAPKVPDTRWDDIGGLAEAKQVILDTIQLSIDHPNLFASGLRRSGVLLYGPPGCGKTLLAKAVASECHLTFLSVKGPELLNMYVGQSEQNVREVFERARAAAPCVIFFDELDSLAPNRGRAGDSGGVMDRVVSQLMAELDGVEKNGDLFVIGATNRPDLIDPSLLRPGRFDKMVYVGIGDDFDSKLRVLQAVSRKLNLDNDVDLSILADQCPAGMSGADFYSLAARATTHALGTVIDRIEHGELKESQASVTIGNDDFAFVLAELRPSVTNSDMQRYSALKDVM